MALQNSTNSKSYFSIKRDNQAIFQSEFKVSSDSFEEEISSEEEYESDEED